MITPMLTTDANTRKLWALRYFTYMYKTSEFGRMARVGIIKRADELDRAQVGDEITVGTVSILNGLGVTEGGSMKNSEEQLDTGSFKMSMNVTRHAVLSPNDDTIEQQRTYIRFEKEARRLLPQWHGSRLDASAFNQLAGVDSDTITVDGAVYSGALKTIVQGMNTVNAPTTNRIIRAGGVANDESLTSSHTMTLDLIDAAVESLANSYPNVAPLENEVYYLYISPEESVDLKRDSSGKIQWYMNYLSAMEGGQIADNPIMKNNAMSSGEFGVYGNVHIFVRYRVANGVNSATGAAIPNVRRAVLCGSNALKYASPFSGVLEDMTLGESTEGNVPIKLFTELDDYEYNKGIEARRIDGMKKFQADGEDAGVCVISTYAAPHTS